MIKKFQSDTDVVTMARIRLKNLFDSVQKVELAFSGGKDSIVLNDLVFQMARSGEIDKDKIIVDFIDEEAIFPCVEKIVKKTRLQWLSIGVEFNWWCIQVKHYNCFNQLTNDESFICWDETKKDVWVRQKPKFAITNDPLLRERVDTYQAFFARKYCNMTQIMGLRVSESIQRMNAIASRKEDGVVYPIYDWHDQDVWHYIAEHNLEYPDAYEYMYRVGVPLPRMRISQFFSIDTAKTLTQMCEYYPGLFDKICKREPNAYMAMLYWDTEFFRTAKAKETKDVDYKAKFFETLKEDWRYQSKTTRETKREMSNFAMKYAPFIPNTMWKTMYQCLTAGDPKGRKLRSLHVNIAKIIRKESQI